MLVLSAKICQAVKGDNFLSLMICGRRGVGKTAYSLWSLHESLVELGYSDSKAWDLALGSLKFSISDVVGYLSEAVESDTKQIGLIWDDVRSFASGSMYHSHVKLVSKLTALLDVVRTGVHCLILTTPSSKGLLGVLTSYDDFLVKVHHSDQGGMFRQAVAYRWSTLPSGQRRIYKKFKDNYSCYLPKKIYDRYTATRKTAMLNILSEISILEKEANKE